MVTGISGPDSDGDAPTTPLMEGRSGKGSVWLVGVQLDPDSAHAGSGPELYTLLFEAKDERPVVSRGRIVLFTLPELAGAALQMEDDAEVREGLTVTDDVYAVYPMGQALSLIRDANDAHDEEASIVDCLNLLFDCVDAIGLPLPAEYREPMQRLADHLTFSKSLSEFGEAVPGWREPVLNGILWCLGAVAANSIVLTSAALNAAGSGPA
jgi:hypothetical protein